MEYKRQKRFTVGTSKDLSKINFCPSKTAISCKYRNNRGIKGEFSPIHLGKKFGNKTAEKKI